MSLLYSPAQPKLRFLQAKLLHSQLIAKKHDERLVSILGVLFFVFFLVQKLVGWEVEFVTHRIKQKLLPRSQPNMAPCAPGAIFYLTRFHDSRLICSLASLPECSWNIFELHSCGLCLCSYIYPVHFEVSTYILFAPTKLGT